jgi:hypothetical protein
VVRLVTLVAAAVRLTLVAPDVVALVAAQEAVVEGMEEPAAIFFLVAMAAE